MISRILGWAFTVLSVVVMWQARIEGRLQNVAAELGAAKGSLLYSAFVDVGVPMALGISLVAFNWFYGMAFWRLLARENYLGGWWVYSLLAETPEGLKDTVGYFYVTHLQEEIRIDEGQAFWPLKDFVLRGNWKSETVWCRQGRIKLVYAMTSAAIIEGLPTDYEGYLELSRSSRKSLLGKHTWTGSFNDLKHRGTIKGPVYAEQLSPWSRLDVDRLKILLVNNSSALLERVHEFWPSFIKAATPAQRQNHGLSSEVALVMHDNLQDKADLARVPFLKPPELGGESLSGQIIAGETAPNTAPAPDC